MGQFSWMYADTKNCKAMLDDVARDSYLLVPSEFTGKYGEAIHETCYDGYGNFADKDIYCLVAEWNREMIPDILRKHKRGVWRCSISDRDEELLQRYYEGGESAVSFNETRYVGIIMGCYDEDNARLDYPIKITTKPMAYNSCYEISESDPNHGWGE